MEQQEKGVAGVVPVVLAAAALGLVVVGEASAASVIDTTMKASLTAGFTDLMDTVKDVIGTAWPFILSATVLLAAPGLVQRMVGKVTGR